tara:strand:+ start:321 stop:500 length:180 start_codon:yes stop_codon:yes gene_type:complete
MNDHENRLVDESIQAYKNMIKYLKKQIHQLQLKKLKVEEDCSQCIPLDIPIVSKQKAKE